MAFLLTLFVEHGDEFFESSMHRKIQNLFSRLGQIWVRTNLKLHRDPTFYFSFLMLLIYLLVACYIEVGSFLVLTNHRQTNRRNNHEFTFLSSRSIDDSEQKIFNQHIASLDLKSNIQTLYSSKSRIKAYCISDLHVDSKFNLQWTLENCIRKAEDLDVFTILILPGDIGTETEILDKVFAALIHQYDAVFYLPGNHEVWRRGTASGGSVLSVGVDTVESVSGNREAVNSLMKYKEVMLLAENRSIHTTPIYVTNGNPSYPDEIITQNINQVQMKLNQNQSEGIWIVPIQSWYHSSWDTEPDITHPDYLQAQQVIPFFKMWSDFLMCSWPADLISHEDFISLTSKNDALARFFDCINDKYLPDIQVSSTDTVLSFSHFVPRQELCPEKRFLLEPLLSRVIGSVYLEKRIRSLKPHLHMFGHTHIPIDLMIDGIRYLQWPLGTHKESKRQCAIVHDTGPLLVYDSTLTGTGIPQLIPSEQTHWTQYYRQYQRTPSVTDVIAPWVQKRLDRYRGLIDSALKSKSIF